MFQTSIAVSVMKKLWNSVCGSMLYRAVLSLFSFFAGSFSESRFRSILLSAGNLDKYVRSSLFYRALSAFIGLFSNIFTRICTFVINGLNGSVVKNVYNNIFADSVIFGYYNLFPFIVCAMFIVPHSLWNNKFGLLIAAVLFALYIFSCNYEIISESRTVAGFNAAKIPFSMLLFMFSVFVAVVVSNDVGDSIRVLFFFITSFILCFAVYGRMNSKKMIESFMRMSFAALLFMSAIAIVQRIMGVEANASLTDLTLNKDMPGRVFGTMDNPNNLAEYLTMFIPFGFAYSFNRKSAEERAIHLCFMILPVAAILLTYSRSGWIALAAAVVVYVALYNYKLFPALFIGGIFALPFIPQSIYNRLLTIGNLKDSSSSYRMEIWTGCLDMLKKYWFTGVGLGPGAFAKIFPKYAIGETTVVMHSHMQFMEMMVEGGILCFIAYIAMVFSLIRRACVAAYETNDNSLRHYIIASAASVSGITLIGMFEYCWFYPRVMFAFFICAGLCLALCELAEKEKFAE